MQKRDRPGFEFDPRLTPSQTRPLPFYCFTRRLSEIAGANRANFEATLPAKPDMDLAVDIIGADGGTRTRTRFPGADFKSAASTFSPRPPWRLSPR